MKNLMTSFILLVLFTFACTKSDKKLQIAASAVPHADFLALVKPDLQKQGVHLNIIEIDDYNLPNRLLDEGEVDANFFQHMPFLDNQIKNYHFNHQLVPLARVHLEPLGGYSKKYISVFDLPVGATISIPSDPTNETRALRLLEAVNLIQLRVKNEEVPLSVLDISDNPKKFKIKEIDAALLSRTLSDVDLAVIPANYALQANLNPTKDALVIESSNSIYANVIVVREEDLNREEMQKLKNAMNSEKMRQYIQEKYKGFLIPAF